MAVQNQELTIPAIEVAELETERLPLSDVSPHPDNPRIHTPEQIKAIQESYKSYRGSVGTRNRLFTFSPESLPCPTLSDPDSMYLTCLSVECQYRNKRIPTYAIFQEAEMDRGIHQ
jgi:hypothetical protein